VVSDSVIVSVNDHKQSVGHWNATLGLLGTNTGLPGFSSGGWCGLGGRGALCGSGVVRANGALLVMCKTVQKVDRGSGSARRGTNDLGRIMRLTSTLETYNHGIFGHCSELDRV
jgi:hypothetical protein